MKLKTIVVISLIAASVSGCASNGMGDKQTIGGLLGAVGGGVAGAQVGKGKGQLLGIAAGTLLGALIGSETGRSLDRADQMAIGQTTQRALETSPSNTPVQWSNPDSGHYGEVTSKPAYTNTQGRYCREFQQTVMVGGQEQRAYGTACRQPDGSWQIVNIADSSAANVSAAPTTMAKQSAGYGPQRRARSAPYGRGPRYWH